MRRAQAPSAREPSWLRVVSASLLSPLAYLGAARGAMQGPGSWLGFRVLYVLPSPPSLSVSLSPGRPSPGALSHLPPPRSRKPVLTCWPTSAETPLLLPRWHQLLLHSQPLGVSGTWEENLPTTYVPITQGIHSALALCTGMNVMVILKYHGWEGGGQMSTAGIRFGSLTRKHGSWGLPALPLRALERAFFLVSLCVKVGQGDCHRFHFPCPLPEHQQ